MTLHFFLEIVELALLLNILTFDYIFQYDLLTCVNDVTVERARCEISFFNYLKKENKNY